MGVAHGDYRAPMRTHVGRRSDGDAQVAVGTGPPPVAVVAGYTVVAYAVTWVVVAPLALAGLGVLDVQPPAWLHIFGALGPAAGAAAMTWRSQGSRGLAQLWDRVWNPRRIRGRWWLVVLSPLLLVAATAAVVVPFDPPAAIDGPRLLIAVVGSLSYGVFEEIGWRGFLLPRLQAHMTAIRASGWVFVIWALWHLPMFAYQLPRGLVAIAWIVGLYYGSVWLAMLHNGTAGSVLACIVWHAGYNVAVTAGAELSPLVPAVVTTMVVIATIMAVRRVGTEDLGTRGRFMIAAHTSAAGAARS